MENWVHVIGICGVTTSSVAVMFKQLGWKVSGSDRGFFPPISTYLQNNGIQILPGFKPERLTINGIHPDLVVIQGTKGEMNAELREAKRLQLTLKTYPEILKEYVIKPEASIVVAGTYGKTTITAALVAMFRQAKIPVSYMFGGLSDSFDVSIKPRQADTRFSIVEGDEYLTSWDDKRSKFFHYTPTHLIINAISWEHPDLFPTEAEYIAAFLKLIKLLPSYGRLLVNAQDKIAVAVARSASCKVIYYGSNEDGEQGQYYAHLDWLLNVTSSPQHTFIHIPSAINSESTAAEHALYTYPGRELKLDSTEVIPFDMHILGSFNERNLLAASAMAYELGVKKERIQEAIEQFRGIKRRLEVRYQDPKVVIVDDFGSSPPKAQGSIASIREAYPGTSLIVVFEPNTGNRTQQALPLYNDTFKQADTVILPEFTKLPKSSVDHFDAPVLARKLAEYHHDVVVEIDDAALIKHLIDRVQKSERKMVIAFMGSHSFRQLIPDLVKAVSQS